MISRKPIYDVILAHAADDAGTATVVQRAFEEKGLSVFPVQDFSQVGEPLREAVMESSAFVAILTRAALNSGLITFLTGAVSTWEKPCFYLLQSGLEAPSFLKSYPVYPLAKVSQVVDAAVKASAPLSDNELKALASTYVEVGLPTDQLADEPHSLQQFASEFKVVAGSNRAPERLLQELLRLRKRGTLPKIQTSASATKTKA